MIDHNQPASSGKVPVVDRSAGRELDMQDGYHVLSYLIAGPLLYGGLGWLADRHFGTWYWVPTGLIVGLVLGIYMIVHRFGKVNE